MNKKLCTIAIIGALAPWQALAADASSSSGAKSMPMTQGHGSGAHDEWWDKIDTNHDGVISKEEWMKWSEDNFKEIDANGDGKITKEEMAAHREKMRERFKENHPGMMHRGGQGNDQGAPAKSGS